MTTAEIFLGLIAVIEALIIYIWYGMKEEVKRHGVTLTDHERRLIIHETTYSLHLAELKSGISGLQKQFTELQTYIHEKEHKETDLISQQRDVINQIWKHLQPEAHEQTFRKH